jgi:peptidoglycan/LPS O-acetylase OafA/YrhL
MAPAHPPALAEPATGIPIRHYRPELDVVRFFAFFTVFLHHSLDRKSDNPLAPVPDWQIAIANACGFGLCLFFVLSAFLISDLLMKERLKNGKIDIAAFYQRRIRRIWPLYILGLVIGIFVGYYNHHPETWRFVAYFFLAGNWYCSRYGWSGNAMVPLWTISIEEQFYLLWPTVAARASRRTMFAICGALIVIANAFLFYYGRTHADLDVVVWSNSFVQFEMFAAGILVSLWLHQHLPRWRWPLRTLLFLLWPACWFSAVYFFHAKEYGRATSAPALIAGYALAAIGSSALLLALIGIPARFVPRWIAYLGRISYGLYVFHLLAAMFVFGLIVRMHLHISRGLYDLLSIAVTIAIAAVSYKYFETPFLRKRPVRI